MAIISPILTSLALFFVSYWAKEEWMSKDQIKSMGWKRINIVSLLVSLVVSLSFALAYDMSEHYLSSQMLTLSAISALIYCLIQSVTDFFSRRVYRWTLRSANIIVFVFAAIDLLMHGETKVFAMYVIAVLVVSLLSFVPSIGMSDVRALQLVAISVIPIVGFFVFVYYYLIGFTVAILLYAVILSIMKKDFKILIKRISIPLVPIIISPALIILFWIVLI